MSSKIEKIEKNIATINIEISPEDFNKAVEEAYKKNKSKFNIPGFRKGKAPRKIIENNYGANVFYEDALDIAFPVEYTKVIEENDLKPVAMPNMTSLESLDTEKGAKLAVEVALEPEFEVAEYKGIEIAPIKYTPTAADVKERLEQMREQNSRLVAVGKTAKAKDGDTVIIDFEGFVDEVPFEGGQAENYSLELGSGSFIPGFEDQLIGKKTGDEVDVNVTFPTPYQSKELEGKDAIFKVKIHEIKRKELPKIDDEFAEDISEFDTLKELKADLKKKIKEERENSLKNAATEMIISKIAEATEIDIPKPMIDEKTEQVKSQFEQQIIQNGLDPKTYYELMKQQDETKSEDSFNEMFVDQAGIDLKNELIITKLLELEKDNVEPTDADRDEEYTNFAKAYNQSAEDFKKNLDDYTKDYIDGFIKQRKLFDILVDSAKVNKDLKNEHEHVHDENCEHDHE